MGDALSGLKTLAPCAWNEVRHLAFPYLFWEGSRAGSKEDLAILACWDGNSKHRTDFGQLRRKSTDHTQMEPPTDQQPPSVPAMQLRMKAPHLCGREGGTTKGFHG